MIDWDGAKAYRTELRRAVNMHKGMGRHCRPATMRERWGRLARLCEGKLNDALVESWTLVPWVRPEALIDDVIERLVALRYPGAGAPPLLGKEHGV